MKNYNYFNNKKMGRRINKREELDSNEEIIKIENIAEKESIEVELKASGEEIPEINDNLPEEEPMPSEKEFNFNFEKDYLLSAPSDKEVEIDQLPKIVVTMTEEDVKDLDVKWGIDAEEEIEEIISKENDVEVKVKVLPEQPRNMESLSRSQLRIFQRTGRLPN